jgi:uncharacterized membrane protein YebE (DUF533 family)
MTHVINLIAIANIDGNITESEKQLIFDIADHLGLTDDEFDVCVKTCIDSPDKVLRSARHRRGEDLLPEEPDHHDDD